MTEIIIYIIAGFILLYIGSEGLVRGSSALAINLGVSPLLVGLTIVAFGTSSPELVVSIKTALSGQGDISLGNVVGSNIANILVILGTAAVIKPVKINSRIIKIEIPIMIGVSAVLFLFMLNKYLGLLEGILLFAGLIAFTIFSYVTSKEKKEVVTEKEFENEYKAPRRKTFLNILMVIAGLAALVFGSNLFVDGAVKLARIFGLSEAFIGLTIVAIGTSLPELATSVVASIKGEGDIAIGNVVGSNIFNILGILGIAAMINPLVSGGINVLDFSVMIITASVLLPLAFTGMKISRGEGAFLLLGYAAYVYILL